MPRNSKSRRVCAEFNNRIFAPQGLGLKDIIQKNPSNELTLKSDALTCKKPEYIVMNVDEIEALRLCDLEGIQQDDAAKRMEVSRGTLQRILYAARQKSAMALCEGKGVLIEGGNYELATKYCNCSKPCRGCRMKECKGDN